MKPSLRSALPRIAVVLVVALVVVAGSIAIPSAVAPSPDVDRIDNPAYNLSNIVPEEPDASGDVTVDAAADRGTVLIDFAHSNRVSKEAIQPLTSAIRDAGYRVEFLESSFQLREKLSEADAFVVIDPAQRYTRAEVDIVEWFVEKGGRLALFGEPTQATIGGAFGGLILQTNQLGSLADRFGIDYGSEYLFNMRENEGIHRNIFARAAGESEVASGVDRVSMYTATQVSVQDGQPVLVATEATRSARGDAPGRYPVGVRTGNVLAFGDATFLAAGNYQVVDNERLIGNVVSFLLEGDRRRTLLDYPANVAPDPSITYTSAELLSAAQSLGLDFRRAGEQPTLVLEKGRVSGSGTDVLLTTFDDLRNGSTRGTGISLTRNEVSVPGFSADREGVAIVHAPAGGKFDVVIAADTAANAERAAGILTGQDRFQYAISNSTLVVRQETGFGGL